MKRFVLIATAAAILLLCFWALYSFWPRVPEKRLEVPLNLVAGENLPRFVDDQGGAGLVEAITHHINRLEKKNLEEKVNLGQLTVTRRRILSTLKCMQKLVEKKGLSGLSREIPMRFLVYQSSGLTNQGNVLFTGYYQPVIEARTVPDEEYSYPVYMMPQDLQILDLGKIDHRYAGERIGLRVEEGIIKPYYDREAIDSEKVLAGRGLELVYLKDFLDRYMLHVQGSGIMKIENKREIRLRFAASNGFPYVSLGRLLIEDKKIAREGMSLKAIRGYYEENPKEIETYLNRNPRYIFFEEFEGAVNGSEGVPLTPGRSIATDKTLFPGGGLAFISCKLPRRNEEGEVIGWNHMGRFVVDQDTGAAIKGPGRVDVFWGTGEQAGITAGGLKETGKLYYLLVKED